jgi:thiamine phosphate synthase YjbQ (UPF0047 family)
LTAQVVLISNCSTGIATTLQRHGHIELLVNNAEHAISEAIEAVLETAVRAAQES